MKWSARNAASAALISFEQFIDGLPDEAAGEWIDGQIYGRKFALADNVVPHYPKAPRN
jgi:hypothetical protein